MVYRFTDLIQEEVLSMKVSHETELYDDNGKISTGPEKSAEIH